MNRRVCREASVMARLSAFDASFCRGIGVSAYPVSRYEAGKDENSN
jgi:hypothetical protein